MVVVKFLLILFLICNMILKTSNLRVELTKIECIPNKELCTDNYCYLKTLRRNLNSIFFSCFCPLQLKNIMVTVSMQQQFSGKFKTFLDTREDFCGGLERSGRSPILSRVLPLLEKHSNLPKRCPIEGNISLSNYPLDLSIFPSIVPKNQYLFQMGFFDAGRNQSVVLTKVWFRIN